MTAPEIPTRDEIEAVIVDVAKRWWPEILFSGTVAEFVVDELVERDWVHVSDAAKDVWEVGDA